MNDKKPTMSVEEKRLANSTMISQTSLALMVTSIPYIMFVLEKRILEPSYVAAIAVGISLLVFSNILGGKGISRISNPKKLFDYQAKTCLLGFIVLYFISFFCMGAPLKDSTRVQITEVLKELGQLNERIEASDLDYSHHKATIDTTLRNMEKAIKTLEERPKEAQMQSECQ